ncbi:hypothetical protein N234_31765 [Ralstonia pickettii DTP0602]|nr:hypothetical protein N234_31765 [Ralstonia pickettii DTP0602]
MAQPRPPMRKTDITSRTTTVQAMIPMPTKISMLRSRELLAAVAAMKQL